MTISTLMHRILPLVLGAAALCSAQAAAPSFNLGPASDFSAYFYGNATNFTDIEGRMAVGGYAITSGASIGYRTPFGVTAPSLVVGSYVRLNGGDIYAAPLSNVDTNASIGPITEYTKNYNGYGVYGSTNASSSYLNLQKADISTYTDFGAAKTQLTALSSTLNSQAANGTVNFANGGIELVGNNTTGLQVFNVNTRNLSNLTLSNVKDGATVVINVTGTGDVVFGGGQDGLLEHLRANVLFNLNDATDVKINTFVWGSVLANNGVLSGAGHLEGSVVARAMVSAVEIGYEPFKGYVATPVPEPETYAMLLGGLALMGVVARRRKA
ncbi:choice-of-anchor A family protein [Duganella violaceipulchra]|uniref:Choice-of-anchor A domain-containing protein n=1 Tax=Duganella violaceipulchra TaxID=2849652 RepID=A0AA41HC90_9BURK|nr:choice-of-anchor A family protein [Duganella violaceicalia]MBV6323450.1 choice-of-anchor A family protein [Duganella violaceicalia]MCP2007596.1 choice-of-anchor A domain-containing protein [Duganella violaceicalia]